MGYLIEKSKKSSTRVYGVEKRTPLICTAGNVGFGLSICCAGFLIDRSDSFA